jgi:peptidoglycan hydrolase-like protein with peptidoglycan-binding domain
VALLLALVVFGLDQGVQKRTSVNGPDDHFESIAGPATLSASSELSGGEDKIAFAALTKEPGVAAADPLAGLPRSAPVPMVPLEASDSALANALSLPRLDVGSHTETSRLKSLGLGMSPAASAAQTAAKAPPPGRLSLPVPQPVKIDEPLAVSDKFRQGQDVTGIPLAEDNLRYEQVASTAITELPRLIDQEALLTGSPIDAAQIGSPMHMVSDLPTAASEREMLAAIETELALTGRDRAVLQRRLWLLGFNPRGVDGIFGPRSRAAISSWQSAQGFPATGYLDGDQVADINTMSRHLYADWAASASRAKNAGVAGKAPGAADQGNGGARADRDDDHHEGTHDQAHDGHHGDYSGRDSEDRSFSAAIDYARRDFGRVVSKAKEIWNGL